jgi:hypothetical protein
MAKKRRGPRARRPAARDKRLALAITASALAASALAGCDGSPSRGVAGRAPDCPPASTSSPYEASWDDPNGCWDRRPDGQRAYRTTWGGHYYYNPSPPYYSRYYEPGAGARGSSWFSGSHSSSGGGYHGAPSGAG